MVIRKGAGDRGNDDFISLCPPQMLWLLHSHMVAGAERGCPVGALGRPRMDSGPRGCPGPGHCGVKVSAPPVGPVQAGQAGAHPLLARPTLGALGAHCTIAAGGMQPGQFPRDSQLRVGPSPWQGDQNHTRQNINYCCFQSPTTGGCLALPRKSK